MVIRLAGISSLPCKKGSSLSPAVYPMRSTTFRQSLTPFRPLITDFGRLITRFGNVITHFGMVITDFGAVAKVITISRNGRSSSRRNR
jgi:hypothetical protein